MVAYGTGLVSLYSISRSWLRHQADGKTGGNA